jgi:hypothetical protein
MFNENVLVQNIKKFLFGWGKTAFKSNSQSLQPLAQLQLAVKIEGGLTCGDRYEAFLKL